MVGTSFTHLVLHLRMFYSIFLFFFSGNLETTRSMQRCLPKQEQQDKVRRGGLNLPINEGGGGINVLFFFPMAERFWLTFILQIKIQVSAYTLIKRYHNLNVFNFLNYTLKQNEIHDEGKTAIGKEDIINSMRIVPTVKRRNEKDDSTSIWKRRCTTLIL